MQLKSQECTAEQQRNEPKDIDLMAEEACRREVVTGIIEAGGGNSRGQGKSTGSKKILVKPQLREQRKGKIFDRWGYGMVEMAW